MLFRSCDDNVSELALIGVDLDCGKLGMDPQAVAGLVEAILADHRIPVTFWLYSGTGLWFFIRLRHGERRQAPANTEKHGRAFADCQRRFQVLLAPFGVDAGSSNRGRICRLSGSVNEKNGARVYLRLGWQPTDAYSDEGPDISLADLCDRLGVKPPDRKSTRLNSSHSQQSRMPSSA